MCQQSDSDCPPNGVLTPLSTHLRAQLSFPGAERYYLIIRTHTPTPRQTLYHYKTRANRQDTDSAYYILLMFLPIPFCSCRFEFHKVVTPDPRRGTLQEPHRKVPMIALF